jgi:alpha,alpha-trehalose phosphorylase
MVSFVHRHLAVMTFEVTLLDAQPRGGLVAAPEPPGRRGRVPRRGRRARRGLDPRQASKFDHRVLEPRLQREEGNEIVLGYRCANSRMTLACGTAHHIDTVVQVDEDRPSAPTSRRRCSPCTPPRATDHGSPSSSLPLVDRRPGRGARRPLFTHDRARRGRRRRQLVDRAAPVARRVLGDVRHRTARRRPGPAGAPVEPLPARAGVGAHPGAGHRREGGHRRRLRRPLLLGHRGLRRCRSSPTPIRKRRARSSASAGRCSTPLGPGREMSQVGCAVSVAHDQRRGGLGLLRRRHRAVPHQRRCRPGAAALPRRVRRHRLPRHEGAEILVETARLWARSGSTRRTAPGRSTSTESPDPTSTPRSSTTTATRTSWRGSISATPHAPSGSSPNGTRTRSRNCAARPTSTCELDAWDAAADAMFIPFDDELGIHPQDSRVPRTRTVGLGGTPPEEVPLLLHYHPLVIYRHQVLKQADVVLAMFLRSEHFPIEQKRRNFDFYDPITTGDSSLSACVQAVVAAEVGYDDLALEYFTRSLYLDLCDSHGNTADGVHVASMPAASGPASCTGSPAWSSRATISSSHRGCRVRGTGEFPSATPRLDRRRRLDPDGLTLTVLAGSGVPCVGRRRHPGDRRRAAAHRPLSGAARTAIERDHQTTR